MERYSRNRIYVNAEEQKKVRNTRILLGGVGIGSIIAECALRFGFENITIVDGDKVELSNLNRQNYTEGDIGTCKAEALAKRLLSINPSAGIAFVNSFIDHENVESLVKGHDIAINALDFKSDIPFVFDEICSREHIPVLHPYNFGWAGFLTIVKPEGYRLTELSKEYRGFELKVAEYVSNYEAFWNLPNQWLAGIVEKYKREAAVLPPPQLSVGSWIAAGHCVNAMYNIVAGKEVKYFPKFYLSSLMCETAR
ncbi:ThiF family adenylyltransferase [Palleniella muris]|uniref:ThiF family adenylyltransferase n=1 Tax=Palleniella muris TaxID=3038145 RepID=A0AC61QMK0_9BACT|nr:ThiF family adenylyltransferase [Palleniella muris]TGX80464.1 ThiF family adenylyltransferase [Palleniella muris]